MYRGVAFLIRLRVAVTGASGFVGRAVVAELCRRGHQAVAITRGGTQVAGAHQVASISGLDDSAGLGTAFTRADAVVHLAARVHVMRERAVDPLTLFRSVNVKGTRTVLAAARRARVERFVFVSSAKVHGEGRERAYRESDTPEPVGPYAQSKWEAEQEVERAALSGFRAVTLRLPLVYGTGVRGNFRRLLRLAEFARWVPVPLGGIRNCLSFLYLENLAHAIASVVEHEIGPLQTYLVSDGEDLSTSMMIRRTAAALGGRARLVPCPTSLLRNASRLVGCTAETDRLLGTFQVDSSAIRNGIAWVPPFTVDEGLRRTAEWWLSLSVDGRAS